MIEYALIALALLAAGYMLGRWYRQPSPILPVKQDNDHINRLQARVDQLESLCADIHQSTATGTSGTARMVARKALSAFAPSEA